MPRISAFAASENWWGCWLHGQNGCQLGASHVCLIEPGSQAATQPWGLLVKQDSDLYLREIWIPKVGKSSYIGRMLSRAQWLRRMTNVHHSGQVELLTLLSSPTSSSSAPQNHTWWHLPLSSTSNLSSNCLISVSKILLEFIPFSPSKLHASFAWMMCYSCLRAGAPTSTLVPRQSSLYTANRLV